MFQSAVMGLFINDHSCFGALLIHYMHIKPRKIADKFVTRYLIIFERRFNVLYLNELDSPLCTRVQVHFLCIFIKRKNAEYCIMFLKPLVLL